MSAPAAETPQPISRARRAGQIVQGLIVGPLLLLALFGLLAQAGDITPFRYQGF